MPYLTAIAHLEDGLTYKIDVGIANSFRIPIPLLVNSRLQQIIPTDIDGDDPEALDKLTSVLAGHGIGVAGEWIATQFGIQARIKVVDAEVRRRGLQTTAVDLYAKFGERGLYGERSPAQ